jgi:hypothetical protein
VDFSWIQISILKFLGLAKSIRVVKVQTPVADREAA